MFEIINNEYKTNIIFAILQREKWANINVKEFEWWLVEDSKEKQGEKHIMGNLEFIPNNMADKLKKIGVKKDVVSEFVCAS